jgi:drug/metabolite transporter (DMT)-like permease
MILLLITSFIWAFSFGLVKKYLGNVDANFVAFARLALALLLFLPMWKPRKTPPAAALRLFFIGMVQYGMMYVFYIQSFRFLAAHQVALFTILTPLYVAVAADLWEKRLQPRRLGAALLAVAGTAVIVYAGWASAGLLSGFLLVQASNACFAVGQVWYRRLFTATPQDAGVSVSSWTQNRDLFAWLYLGGAAAALLAMLFFSGPLVLALSAEKWLVLLYLGLLASGVGFFLWNVGATRVDAGLLAVFNNAKVPLAVLVSLLFFGERADWLRLLSGAAIMILAIWLGSRSDRGRAGPWGKER